MVIKHTRLAALTALLFLSIAPPLKAQEVVVDSIQLERARMEAIRSRGFIRGAETQLSKTLALIDSLVAGAAVSDTTPHPTPDPTPDPPPPSGDAEVTFLSNWDAALGTSTVATTDGGVWDRTEENGEHAEVVPAGPLGFPAGIGNALRVNPDPGTFTNTSVDDLGLELGESHYLRWLTRIDRNNIAGPSHYDVRHTFEYMDFVLAPVSFAGGWHHRFRSSGPNPEAGPYAPYPWEQWITDRIDLELGAVYEIQVYVEILGTETQGSPLVGVGRTAWPRADAVEFRMWPRIYQNGVLVADARDYRSTDFGSNGAADMTLQQYYDSGRTFLTGTHPNQAQRFNSFSIGSNDQYGQQRTSGSPYFYYAYWGCYRGGWPSPVAG